MLPTYVIPPWSCISGCMFTGGIGKSYTLSIDCEPSTAGQLSFLPTAQPLPILSLPLTVQLCGTGTEQVGSFCRQCDLNYYSLDGKNCNACPYGVIPSSKCIFLRYTFNLTLATFSFSSCGSVQNVKHRVQFLLVKIACIYHKKNLIRVTVLI